MEKRAKRIIVFLAAIVGAAMALRPLFFSKPTDPTTGLTDLIVCPIYLIGRIMPPVGDSATVSFLCCAVVANGVLYGVIAKHLASAFERRRHL
jgi:hypothetical protein